MTLLCDEGIGDMADLRERSLEEKLHTVYKC